MKVPWDVLAEGTLDAVIEAFVLQEGTDYGQASYTLEQKVAQVRSQLVRGEAVIVFDEASETCNIVMAGKFSD